MDLVPHEIAQPVEAVIGREVGEMGPEDVVEDGVVRLPDRVHVPYQQRLVTTQAPRDVDVARAIAVQPQREERTADVVRRDGRHPGPLHAGRRSLVDPGVLGGDLQVAVEGAGHFRQEGAGHRLPPWDRVRHPGWGRRRGHLRNIVPSDWVAPPVEEGRQARHETSRQARLGGLFGPSLKDSCGILHSSCRCLRVIALECCLA